MTITPGMRVLYCGGFADLRGRVYPVESVTHRGGYTTVTLRHGPGVIVTGIENVRHEHGCAVFQRECGP